ncbi:Fis family transcriptional regulator [Thiocapsa imhoffii]|uniref:Fis family transcriptional regulator n=1 Tax=Thiocapsa imhoffii TaxID=382777 RepID=A0A9X0WH34_9GAMM|nr:SoxR reducing system RseC family protein [Thiocapsa imhoffii]MBK1644017.1 Fis family transcriptional regulator [Thiocapsa imhoffii]
MIEATATVVESGARGVWVESERQTACGQCASAGACGTAVLGQLFGRQRERFRITGGSELTVGERIIIGIPDRVLVMASTVAYLLPLLMLIGGAALATVLGAGEGGTAGAGLVGLGLGIGFAAWITGGRLAREYYRPLLVRRISPMGTSTCERKST